MKCNDCKFWRKHQGDELGDCSCEKFKAGYQYYEKDILADECWVENDEGWAFYTGKEFGCIHFVHKGEL